MGRGGSPGPRLGQRTKTLVVARASVQGQGAALIASFALGQPRRSPVRTRVRRLGPQRRGVRPRPLRPMRITFGSTACSSAVRSRARRVVQSSRTRRAASTRAAAASSWSRAATSAATRARRSRGRRDGHIRARRIEPDDMPARCSDAEIASSRALPTRPSPSRSRARNWLRRA
jgi:hypothetical protein